MLFCIVVSYHCHSTTFLATTSHFSSYNSSIDTNKSKCLENCNLKLIQTISLQRKWVYAKVHDFLLKNQTFAVFWTKLHINYQGTIFNNFLTADLPLISTYIKGSQYFQKVNQIV